MSAAHIASRGSAAAYPGLDLSATTPWRDACRRYAEVFVDGVVAMGGLADHLPLESAHVGEFLRPTETLLATLRAGGFDLHTSQRAVTLLTNLCLAHARDAVAATAHRRDLRPQTLRTALLAQREEFPLLGAIAADPVDTYGRDQLTFALDVFVAGLEARLDP